MTIKHAFYFVSFVLVLALSVISANPVKAETVTFGNPSQIPGIYFGEFQRNAPPSYNPRAYASNLSGFNVYRLGVWLRAWYLPGIDQGPNRCKINTVRNVYNASSTGWISSTSVFNSYYVVNHSFTYVNAPGASGVGYTSEYGNAYASYSYFYTGGGRWPACDSPIAYG